jgi:hypothetical protein
MPEGREAQNKSFLKGLLKVYMVPGIKDKG